VRAVFFIAFLAVEIWLLCAIGRALLSWFPISYDSVAHRVNSVLVRITEPVIAPVRRLMPPVRAGGIGIDLSFIAVFIVLELIASKVLYPLSH